VSTVAVTASVPRARRLEQAGLAALVGIVATMQFSIAAAQVLLAVAALCWLVLHLSRSEPLTAPSFFWPLVVYAAATLLAAGFSLDPRTSFTDCKQLTLFMLVPVVYDFARGERANTLLSVIITVGAASAFYGIVQYGVLDYDTLNKRLTGTLSHWMTYSGTLMLVICASIARLLYGRGDRLWAAFVMPALVASLALTLTRNSWIGAAAGASVMMLSKDVRLLLVLPAIALVTFLAAPSLVTSRMNSIFDLNDPTNRDRVAMLQAGQAIIADHPLTGVGPDNIKRVYPDYRVPSAVEPVQPHLHNVPMQIAAERGLPALAVWLWMVTTLAVGLVRLMRRTEQRTLTAAALGAVAAMLTAGQFEYNFGDSEFLMLFLVLVTLPFAADRDGGRR
jgi:O-antigen ligase